MATDLDSSTYQARIQNHSFQMEIARSLDRLSYLCHGLAQEAGWWSDPETGEMVERNAGEMIALMHSELSEALEAIRKDKNDDHLPDYKGETVEMADTLIRIFDFCGARQLMVGTATVEKLAYNAKRADHKAENRKAAGGKKF